MYLCVLSFVCGAAFAGAGILALWFALDLGYVREWRRRRRLVTLRGGDLPPATTRQMRRARREARMALPDLRPDRDQGTVQLRVVRPGEDR